MSPSRVFAALLLLALGARTSGAQPPQPGRHTPYHPRSADSAVALRDERGVPRTPRLSLAPSGSYVSLSFDQDDALVDLVGIGGQVDVHVPLGALALLGVRSRFERRSATGPGLGEGLFSDALDAGSVFDVGLVGQLRVINHHLELGLGVGFGASRIGFEGTSEWGYFVDPHMTLRIGRTVGFFVGLGVLYRRWPDSSATEFGAYGSMGLSFLLWSPR